MHKRYLLLITAVVAVIVTGFLFTRKDNSSNQVTNAAQFDARLGEVMSRLFVVAENSKREWEKLGGLEEAVTAGKKNLAQISKIMTMQAAIPVPHDDTNATAYYNTVREIVRLTYDDEQAWLNTLQSTRTEAEFGLKKDEIRDTNERYRARLRERVSQVQSNFARAHGLRLLASTNSAL